MGSSQIWNEIITANVLGQRAQDGPSGLILTRLQGGSGMVLPRQSKKADSRWCTSGSRFWPVLWCYKGFPGDASVEKPACQSKRCKLHGFDSWVGKISWRRAQQLTPVFLPEESHGQRSRAGYSPRLTKSRTRLKWLSTHAHWIAKPLKIDRERFSFLPDSPQTVLWHLHSFPIDGAPGNAQNTSFQSLKHPVESGLVSHWTQAPSCRLTWAQGHKLGGKWRKTGGWTPVFRVFWPTGGHQSVCLQVFLRPSRHSLTCIRLALCFCYLASIQLGARDQAPPLVCTRVQPHWGHFSLSVSLGLDVQVPSPFWAPWSGGVKPQDHPRVPFILKKSPLKFKSMNLGSRSKK